MLSKNQIKLINSLKIKKFRDQHNLFIAEGTKIVPELMTSAIKVKNIFATKMFLDKTVIPKHIAVSEINANELSKISSLTTPNQVLAICEIPSYNINSLELNAKLTLALDNIKDPGNLGTIIRIADWFGIEAIICSNETTDAYNPKVIQSTMGSISRVNVLYTDLSNFIKLERNKKNNIYAAVLDGKNIYEQHKSNGIIVIGNESVGISQDVLANITHKIRIPSFSHLKQFSGEADSLNAAIATAIICSEFRR